MKLTKIIVGTDDSYECLYADQYLQYDGDDINSYIDGFKDGYRYRDGDYYPPEIVEEELCFNKPDWIYSNFTAVPKLEDYLKQLKEEGFSQI